MDEWIDFAELVDRTHDLVDMGLYDDARELLDTHGQLYEDQWEIPYLYSRLYLERERPREALPYLQRSLRLNRSSLDCLMGLFYAYSQMGRLKRAGRCLGRAVRYHPRNEQVLGALIWYYTEVNDLPKAVRCFERAHSLTIRNPETYRNAAIAYQRMGSYAQAEECFVKALEFNPQYDEARDLLADLYILQGEAKRSVELYREHLRRSPKNVRALSRLVFSLLQADQTDKAESIAKETIRLYPNSTAGYVDLAYVCLNVNRTQEALDTALKALEISPIDAEAYRVKAIALSSNDDTTGAEEAFTTALNLDPDNPEVLRDYYHHLRETGRYEEMERRVQQVIDMEQPYCVEDYWFLADYYRQQEKNLRAFHYLHKAHKCMPGDRELIGPLVDIMLDEGHTSYSVPFLLSYVDRMGWDETMNDLARHRRLRNRRAQETMRLLRYLSDRGTRFRSYAFARYFRRFFLMSLVLMLPLFAGFLYLPFGLIGALAGASVCLLSAAVVLVGPGMLRRLPRIPRAAEKDVGG